MRFLFVKRSQSWPRSSGHDVHGYQMMRALHQNGHCVGLLTFESVSEEAVDGLELGMREVVSLDEAEDSSGEQLSWIQRKFFSYWGIDLRLPGAVARSAEEFGADVVVAVGADAPNYLTEIKNRTRVWYAADDNVLGQLSLFRVAAPKTYRRLKSAAVSAVYERAFSNCVDRVWVVSEADARMARLVMGLRAVDVVPNGVDSDFFLRPDGIEQRPNSCVFWGRLDFQPNIDALHWFGETVWPRIKRSNGDAEFTVYGFNLGTDVQELSQRIGFRVHADEPDIRSAICSHQVVVLPFVSGAGIKNKLLEAASLSCPIVASPRALNGVTFPDCPPVIEARSPADWEVAMLKFWKDSRLREDYGIRAREWVQGEHNWQACAKHAASAILR